MTHAMERALLDAILERPLEPTSWHVLADWLEESGDPRSELLRLCLSLHHELRVDQREPLEERARTLLSAGVRPCVPTLINSIGMKLVLIRPGTFWMGSPLSEEGRYTDEDPRHLVTLTRPYYLGMYQITQAEFTEVMGQNPSHFSSSGPGRQQVRHLDTQSFPVESVSWEDATEFCLRLSARKDEKAAGRLYRLPTEAEWEYACRAGVSTLAPFHVGFSLSSLQANFDGGSPYGDAPLGPNLQRTCSVGSYPPNAFGLYDMHGNVWEWCSDWFDPDYYSQSPECDPQGPDVRDNRILRGGSFFYIASSCRTAIRFGRRPDARTNLDGFRVAMTIRSP